MLELEDLGDPTPGKFDWDTSMHKVPPPPVDVCSKGPGSCSSSAEKDAVGDGSRMERSLPIAFDGGHQNAAGGEDLDWSPGRFAAFAMTASNPCPLVVGRIESVVCDDEDGKIMLHWWSPSRIPKSCPRSKNGGGTWSADFVIDEKGEVADRSTESTNAACITFPKLLRGNKLPARVWKAVHA